MNPSDPRNLLPPPPPLYTATTSSSNGRQDFVNPGIQSLPPMSSYSPPQGYGHIPINPMPGPPYHKIAQPMQPRDSIQSQQSVFQQYQPQPPQQSYQQTPHYNQGYSPDQYYPHQPPTAYQQPAYRTPAMHHSMPQQYLPQHMSYQHPPPAQPQPQLTPQNYDPYGHGRPSYLTNQGTPPGITIPQPQHLLSTNTAFSQVQPQASPLQPGASPLGHFQAQRQTASPSRVVAPAATTSAVSTANTKALASSFINTPPSDKSSEKSASPAPPPPKAKETATPDTGASGDGEVRKAMQDTAQQTDKEQKIQKVKNDAVTVPVKPPITKPITVAQKKENAKASRMPTAPIPGAPKQPPGYHDEKPCEWLVGDLVWSKVSGHPWWPCMVAYDPNLGIYTKMQGCIGRGFRMYHVQFFGEVPERGWVSGLRIRKFEGRNQYEELVKELLESMKRKKKDKDRMRAKLAITGSRKAAWEVGVQECLKALPMSRHERKLNFTFKYDMTKNKGGTPNSEEIDIVSFGDHPKMKAKRAYKKQKDGDSQEVDEKKEKKTKSGGGGEESSKDKSKDPEAKKPPSKKKKRKKVDPSELRKRGRKTDQFLKFCAEREEQLKKDDVSISRPQLYKQLDEEWNGMAESDRAKYGSPSSSHRKRSAKKRKREDSESSPSSSPVLKRSKREAKPSRKIQESELSNLNFAKRGLKSKDSTEDSEDEEQSPEKPPAVEEESEKVAEKVTAPKVTSPKVTSPKVTSPRVTSPERPKKSERKSTTPKQSPSPKRGQRKGRRSSDSQKFQALPDPTQDTPKQQRKSTRKASLTDEMSKDFEEMQEEAPLVIDTSALTSALDDPDAAEATTAEAVAAAEKGASSRRTSTSTTPTGDTDDKSSVTSAGTNGTKEKNGISKKEHVCQVCESASGSELLLCAGGCHGAYHLDCIGLQKPPMDTFRCDECSSGTYSCFVCRERTPGLKRCAVMTCGKHYHEGCLDKFPQRKLEHKTFHCPMHFCHTCNADNPKGNKSTRGRFMRCIRCPTSYHAGESCVAAGSVQLNSSTIVCSKHFKPLKKMKHHSHVSVAWCFMCSVGGNLMCCDNCPASFHPNCIGLESIPEGSWYCKDCMSGRRPKYGDIIWVKIGNYRWWPGEVCNPKNVPCNIQEKDHQVGEFPVLFYGSHDYYWMHHGRVFFYHEGDRVSHEKAVKGLAQVYNAGLLEASENFKAQQQARELKVAKEQENNSKKPRGFKFIKTNRPVGNVQMPVFDITSCAACDCNPTMDHPCKSDTDCMNRLLMVECHPQVCPAGEKCENQRFQKRLYPSAAPKKTSERGWGLFTNVDIKKGEFVNEYVGELVDEEECRRRIVEAHDLNITDFYFLTIDKERIIDAGPKGNLSRFMNHSCQPNCETQKWTVNGDTRVGLFALKDIPAGSELNFNYNLESLGNEKKECHCGAPNCSGFIGVRPKTAAAEAQEEKAKKARERKKRKKKSAPKQLHEDDCFRCGVGGQLIMCDRKTCPKSYHMKCLKLQKKPYGKWDCPWHHCDECGKPSATFCCECPNSYCRTHEKDRFETIAGQLYCKEHDLATIRKEEEDKAITAEAKVIQEAVVAAAANQEATGGGVAANQDGAGEGETKTPTGKPKRKRRQSAKVRESEEELSPVSATKKKPKMTKPPPLPLPPPAPPARKKSKKELLEERKRKREAMIEKLGKGKKEPQEGVAAAKDAAQGAAVVVNGGMGGTSTAPAALEAESEEGELVIDECSGQTKDGANPAATGSGNQGGQPVAVAAEGKGAPKEEEEADQSPKHKKKKKKKDKKESHKKHDKKK